MSYSDVWEAHLERVKKTSDTFPELTQLCRLVLDSMWHMKDSLMNVVRDICVQTKKEAPPYQQFTSIYFIRNILYLQGAYLLACGSLCEPSRDLQRTITETIMRGYLFIVNKKEANLMHSLVEGTIEPKDRDYLRNRKYWPFKWLLGELYIKETRNSIRKFLRRLSRSSHPSIISAFVDLKYSRQGVEDCLNIILALSYHNMQMMAEGFLNILDEDLKNAIKSALKKIADFQEEIVMLEPDKEKYSRKIKLKKGNFIKVLK